MLLLCPELDYNENNNKRGMNSARNYQKENNDCRR